MNAGPGRDGDQLRIEELLRINAALAAEVRSLSLGRAEGARSATMPTARRLARLNAERDRLAAELEACRAELAEVSAERDSLALQNRQYGEEIVRLRTGAAGALRRVRARLLGS